jgi:hypothetical protein
MGAYYFLACLLPPLPATLGQKPALPFPELVRLVRRHIFPRDEALLRAQLSVIDTVNWESIDQGRDIFLEGGTLTRGEMEARQNLPGFIQTFMDERERGIRRAHIYDRLWELCYGALLAQAKKEGCRYLIDYISWEVELRNRLAALRLRTRDRSAVEHAVLPGICPFDFTALLSQLEGRKNPLEAERYLDVERLKHISHCQGDDPFSLGALLAFLACAMIYNRWEILQIPYDIKYLIYAEVERG